MKAALEFLVSLAWSALPILVWLVLAGAFLCLVSCGMDAMPG